MIPQEHLWPIDETWNYHCARNEFNTMKRYIEALNRRYGPASNLESFDLKAQIASYEAMRAMFEAFAVNKHKSTGIIQWMLNSAWPETFWQLYDYYLMPNGAFYGARTAGEAVNIIYHYGDHHIYIVSDTLSVLKDLKAEIRIFDDQSSELHKSDITIEIEPNSVKDIADLSGIDIPDNLYFIDLKLKNKEGAIISKNFYWLSQKQDVMDYSGHKWFVTPMKDYADLTALNRLPTATLEVDQTTKSSNKETLVTVNLNNTSNKIAFGLELRIERGNSGQSVVPIFWTDNYVSILPGEKKLVAAHFLTADLQGAKPELKVKGWNIDKH
jgi:exo-1,4-beta-D-glucosaminidase